MKEKPVFSIITASKNKSRTLKNCLESVSSQDFDSKEHIVIDGGSTDSSLEILQRHQDVLSYWVSEPDEGIYHAWNKGLQKASGEWILFLGADDQLNDSRVLTRVFNELETLPKETNIVYGNVLQVDSRDRALKFLGEPPKKTLKDLRKRMTIPNPGTFYHSSLFSTYGLFDPSFKISGDYEFVLRAYSSLKLHYLSGIIVTRMLVGGVSENSSTIYRMLLEDARARSLNGIKYSRTLHIYRVLKHFLKGNLIKLRR